MIVITIALNLAVNSEPTFNRARARGQLAACLSQCKSTATALEMYAVESDGRFPPLSGLAGLNLLITTNFLKKLPTCPATNRFTFLDYTSSATPDRFSFSCVGTNHGECFPGVPAMNIPAYSNDQGPIDHPP